MKTVTSQGGEAYRSAGPGTRSGGSVKHASATSGDRPNGKGQTLIGVGKRGLVLCQP